jgi:putative transposase
MLAMRGVFLSYETVRERCLKFGQTYANGLRHKSPRPGDRWHLVEVKGRLHYLGAGVDQDGDVLDILVQSRRDKRAAKKFFHKLLRREHISEFLQLCESNESVAFPLRPADSAAFYPLVDHRQDHNLDRARHQSTDHDYRQRFFDLGPGTGRNDEGNQADAAY